MTPDSDDRLPRCCPRHETWSVLIEHLQDQFPDLATEAVVTQVSHARNAVLHFGLSGLDQLEVGELLARHQLMILAGDAVEVARLDPEVHVRAGRQATA